MSCGCNSRQQVQSWNDLQCQMPTDPRDIIAVSILGVSVGAWTLSSNYNKPAGASVWIASPITIGGESIISANASDQQQQVTDAGFWNALNTTSNILTTTAPPLRKTVFARAGTSWMNAIPLSLGASPPFTELQLSLMENAATRGDAQGTIPVYRWATGPYSGPQTLYLVFYSPGRYTLGLMGINNNSSPSLPDWSMFEMDVVAVG